MVVPGVPHHCLDVARRVAHRTYLVELITNQSLESFHAPETPDCVIKVAFEIRAGMIGNAKVKRVFLQSLVQLRRVSPYMLNRGIVATLASYIENDIASQDQ